MPFATPGQAIVTRGSRRVLSGYVGGGGVAPGDEVISAPVLTRTSGTQDPIDYTTSFPPSAQHPGYRLRSQVTTIGTTISNADFTGTLQQDTLYVIQIEDYENGRFPWANFMPAFNPTLGTGFRAIRARFETDIPKSGGGYINSDWSNTMDATIAPTYRITFDPTKTPSGYTVSMGGRRAVGGAGSDNQICIANVTRPYNATGKYWIVAQREATGEPRFFIGFCNTGQDPNSGFGGVNMVGMFFNLDGTGYAFGNGGGSPVTIGTASGVTLPAGWAALYVDVANGQMTAYLGDKKSAPQGMQIAVYGGQLLACMQLGNGDQAIWQTDYLPPVPGIENL